VPVDEPGAVIAFEVETEEPLEIGGDATSGFSTGVPRDRRDRMRIGMRS